MLEEFGDFWTIQGDYRCITTNAIIRNGIAVMGKGVALQAAKKYSGLPKLLGNLIQTNGNHVFRLGNGLISFPTKWHFGKESDIELIKQSARELVALLRDDPASRILIARPGDDNGSLQWYKVKSVLQDILADNKFIIVSKELKSKK